MPVTTFRQLLIDEKVSVLEAMKKLDETAFGVLFLAENGRLTGAITDGDIRRWILKNGDIKASASSAANHSPIFVYEEEKNKAFEIMKQRVIMAIPVVNHEMTITDVCFFRSDYNRLKNAEVPIDLPVVIMAGGKGTRLYPYTKILPKPLIPVEDTPISERIIQSFADYGCEEFYMVVNYRKNMIKSYYAECEMGVNIHFVDEDVFLGTGGGLRLLKDLISNTFILTNCDVLVLEDLAEIVRHHKEKHNSVTMVCSLKSFVIPYGVVHFSEGGQLDSFEEKPEMNFFTNTGYYVLEPDIFDYIDKSERIDMPDIVDRMNNSGKKVGIYPIGENAWLDMGQFETMEGMERKLRELDKK